MQSVIADIGIWATLHHNASIVDLIFTLHSFVQRHLLKKTAGQPSINLVKITHIFGPQVLQLACDNLLSVQLLWRLSMPAQRSSQDWHLHTLLCLGRQLWTQQYRPASTSSWTLLSVQVASHMVRGTLPMYVLLELASRRFHDIPAIQDEHVTVTFTKAICHQI